MKFKLPLDDCINLIEQKIVINNLNISFLIICISIFFSACRKKNPDSRPLYITESRLKQLRFAFNDPLSIELNSNLHFPSNDSFYLYQVSADLGLEKEDYVDGWGNYFRGKIVSDQLLIWSFGKKRKNDNTTEDDILIKLYLKDIVKPGKNDWKK